MKDEIRKVLAQNVLVMVRDTQEKKKKCYKYATRNESMHYVPQEESAYRELEQSLYF